MRGVTGLWLGLWKPLIRRIQLASVLSVQVTPGYVPEPLPVVFTVTLSGPTPVPQVFPMSVSGTAVAGVHYQTPFVFSHGVTFDGTNVYVPAGVSSFTITVTQIDDTVYQTPIVRSLTVVVGGKSATGLLAEDDLQIVSISGPSSVVEGAMIGYMVTCTPLAVSAVVSFSLGGTAVLGQDYHPPTFTSGVTANAGLTQLTIPAGTSSFWIYIQTIDDTVVEGDETVQVTVGTQSATTTIEDNDVPVMYITGPAYLAVALRRLYQSRPASAPVVRVRRLSDNAELDIGTHPTTGDLDVQTLLNFTGASGSARVVRWYNQMVPVSHIYDSRAMHLSMTNPLYQPLLVQNGVVTQAEPGKYAVFFDALIDVAGFRRMVSPGRAGTSDDAVPDVFPAVYDTSDPTSMTVTITGAVAICRPVNHATRYGDHRALSLPTDGPDASDLVWYNTVAHAGIRWRRWTYNGVGDRFGIEGWRPQVNGWYQINTSDGYPEHHTYFVLAFYDDSMYTNPPYYAVKVNNDPAVVDASAAALGGYPSGTYIRIGGDYGDLGEPAFHEQWVGYMYALFVYGFNAGYVMHRSIPVLNELRQFANAYYGTNLTPLTLDSNGYLQ